MYIFICACREVLKETWYQKLLGWEWGLRRLLMRMSIQEDHSRAYTSEGSINHFYSNPRPQAGFLLAVPCCVSQPPLRCLQRRRPAPPAQSVVGQLPFYNAVNIEQNLHFGCISSAGSAISSVTSPYGISAVLCRTVPHVCAPTCVSPCRESCLLGKFWPRSCISLVFTYQLIKQSNINSCYCSDYIRCARHHAWHFLYVLI